MRPGAHLAHLLLKKDKSIEDVEKEILQSLEAEAVLLQRDLEWLQKRVAETEMCQQKLKEAQDLLQRSGLKTYLGI